MKTYVKFNSQKSIAEGKNGDKDRKTLYKLMNNAEYGKAMGTIRYKTDISLVNKKKEYLKWTSKSSYMSHKIFDNNLVAICKCKITFVLIKPGYAGMCILDFK